jgi:hypothetical protein
MARNSMNWIQGAVKHEGSFSNYCKRHGSKGGVTQACINKARHSPNHRTENRAVLANTLRHMSHRK